ncbi:MAG TPA: helix-turn-helix transcriptional regulator [Acidobacteriota bacterium]|nr:helix-turn-helix transcriptional regulator [Acidobacteriota bacterium]
MAKRKGGYTISVVAEMYGIHPQTLRMYEREGLLKPSRSEGNTRLYTDADLNRLDLIVNLTRELGVNLAGVEVILNMRDKMESMQREMAQLLDFIRQHFALDEDLNERFRNALVRVPPSDLVQVRRRKTKEISD